MRAIWPYCAPPVSRKRAITTSAAPAADPVQIDLETPFDRSTLDRIIERAFGPGRFAKTAERLREGNTAVDGLSFVAREGGRVVGGVRLWPVRIGGSPALFLGPIAIDADRRDLGLGGRLVERACAAASEAGWNSVLLVGDEPYFGRFGFMRADVRLPGPVDRKRVLIRALNGDAPTGDVTR